MRAVATLILMALSAVATASMVAPIDEVESYVRIRSAPDASSEAIGRLHKSKPRRHVRTLDGWYEVELGDGATGFVSSDWSLLIADDEQDGSSADVAEAPPVTPPDAEAVAEPVPAEAVETPVAEVEKPEETVAETPPDEPEFEEVTDAARAGADDSIAVAPGAAGPPGPPGPPGPAGPPGPPGAGAVKGTENYLVKFKAPTVGGNSQVYDNGNRVGIGTDEPEQRLEVNGSLQIHDRTSAVAGVMITQIRGESGYILHNQAGTLTIGAGSVDRITIDADGDIGFSVNRPEHPLELASGAYVSDGGVWTNSSARARKENIESLTLEDALAALARLEPVEFNYKSDTAEKHVGFIAEDVPELVATSDRKSLSPMDIVAVLTRVVQQQQERIQALERQVDAKD